MEAVETLKRISGIDNMFSLSLHELTACIYYKLAIDRGLRGCNPDGEDEAHQIPILRKRINEGEDEHENEIENEIENKIGNKDRNNKVTSGKHIIINITFNTKLFVLCI